MRTLFCTVPCGRTLSLVEGRLGQRSYGGSAVVYVYSLSSDAATGNDSPLDNEQSMTTTYYESVCDAV